MKHAAVKYLIRRVEMRTFSIPHQATSWTQENIMFGQLPRHVVFFFVVTNAVHGQCLLIPMHLEHCTIHFFSLHMDDRQVPSTALQPSFGGNDTDNLRTYMQMQNDVGMAFRDEDCSLSCNAFGHGSTVFVFDLKADLSNTKHLQPTNRGILRAEVLFSIQLPHTVTCFVHAKYDNCIEIYQDRNISLDYLI